MLLSKYFLSIDFHVLSFFHTPICYIISLSKKGWMLMASLHDLRMGDIIVALRITPFLREQLIEETKDVLVFICTLL